MSESTPTTAEVRARMVESIAGGTISVPGGYGDLARDDAEHIVDAILDELAAHDAEVAAKALEDAAGAFDGGTISLDVFSNEVEKSYWRVANERRSILVDSLRARAAEYRKAVQPE